MSYSKMAFLGEPTPPPAPLTEHRCESCGWDCMVLHVVNDQRLCIVCASRMSSAECEQEENAA